MGIPSINEPSGHTWMVTPVSINEPIDLPTIEGLNPSEVTANEQVVVVVHGNNFTPDCVVKIDGAAVPTTFEKPTKLNVQGSFNAAGVFPVTVALGPLQTASLPLTVIEDIQPTHTRRR
jgi:hypothetical protein